MFRGVRNIRRLLVVFALVFALLVGITFTPLVGVIVFGAELVGFDIGFTTLADGNPADYPPLA